MHGLAPILKGCRLPGCPSMQGRLCSTTGWREPRPSLPTCTWHLPGCPPGRGRPPSRPCQRVQTGSRRKCKNVSQVRVARLPVGARSPAATCPAAVRAGAGREVGAGKRGRKVPGSCRYNRCLQGCTVHNADAMALHPCPRRASRGCSSSASGSSAPPALLGRASAASSSCRQLCSAASMLGEGMAIMGQRPACWPCHRFLRCRCQQLRLHCQQRQAAERMAGPASSQLTHYGCALTFIKAAMHSRLRGVDSLFVRSGTVSEEGGLCLTNSLTGARSRWQQIVACANLRCCAAQCRWRSVGAVLALLLLRAAGR